MADQGAEINVLGTFAWDSEKTQKRILKEMESHPNTPDIWFPDSASLSAVAAQGGGRHAASRQIQSFGALLGVIAEAGRIGRLNIFTHGDAGFVGFKGTVIR